MLPVLVVVSKRDGRSVRNPTTTLLVAWVWLLLAVAFAAQAGRYTYLTFYQGGPDELLRSKIIGLADGIPLALLCLSNFFLQRKTALESLVIQILMTVTVGLGLCFLGVGLFDIFDSWPDPEKSFQPSSLLLITLGFVGYPLGVVLVAHRYWRRSATMTLPGVTLLPFSICIGLHILEFLVWWFWPFGSASLYGSASLALFFAATNFSLLTSPTDLRP